MVNSAMFDLTGKVALMTGASKGMGKAMAYALASHGAEVVISARTQETLDKATQEINEAVGAERVLGFVANAGRKDELQSLVDYTRDAFGGVDILAANAGINIFYGHISDVSDEAYDKTMATNVQAHLWLAKMVAPDIMQRGGGSMMFMASVGAFKPSLTLGLYGMSKLALIGLVRNLALEYGPHGIRANAICPGIVKTDFSRAIWDNPDAFAVAQSKVPLRRLGEADDFGGLAVFLASDSSSYITGQTMTVCGGAFMWS